MNATANSGSSPDEQPGDDRDRARGRDRGDVAVAEHLHWAHALAVRIARARLVGAPDRARPLGERATLVGEPLALLLRLDIQELHHLPPHLHSFGRIVRNAEAHEHVREAHDAEADAANALGEGVDLRERILVDVDDVVEEVRRELDVALERVPVHAPVDHVVADVDAAEVADVVRKQRLLAAGIRRLVQAEVRHRVEAVRLVDVEAPRLARAPRAFDHAIPHHLRVELPRDALGDGINEVVRLTRAERRDEVRRDRDGDVEVHDLREVFLAGDELEDVRMIDAQNSHVRAAARAALLHRIRGRVVELHEGDRTGRDAGGGAHHRSFRAQTRKGEPRATARLVNERHRPERVVDARLSVGQRVVDGEYEARGELAERSSRVHQRGGVGLEPALRHEAVELIRHRSRRSLARTVPPIRLSHHRRHTPEEILRLLGWSSSLVLYQIALLEDNPCILAEGCRCGGASGLGHDGKTPCQTGR